MATIETEVQKLEPGALVELFKLDSTSIGGSTLYFHGGTVYGPIWWQGQQYDPWPLQVEGFARTSEKQPTPTLTVANLEGSISELCRLFDDLVGSVVTRIRTFGQFLDVRNFDGPELIYNGQFRDSVAGWTVAAGGFVWYNTGRADLGHAAVISEIRQSIQTEVGKTYTLRYNADVAICSTQVGTTAGGTQILANANGILGDNARTFTATTTTTHITFRRGVSSTKARIDGVSVREVGTNPTANPAEEFAPEVWFIDRKSGESNENVQFELASAFDLNGVQLPRRLIIANYCSWKSIGGYRGPYCGYTGGPVAKADDTPTAILAEDDCGGKISSCKLRDWPDDILNFGGFPAAGLVRT